MSDNHSVLNSYVAALVATVKRQGIPEKALLSALPLEQQQLSQSSSRIDMELMTQLWQRAVDLTEDEYLGLHVGQQIPQGAINVLSGLIVNSNSVRTAVELVLRYQSLISDGGLLTLNEEGENCFLQYTPTPHKSPMTHYQIEGVICSLIKIARDILPLALIPLRAEFVHPEPSDKKPYEDFLSCPVCFQSSRNGLLFSIQDLALTIPHADPEIFLLHKTLADQKLKAANRLQGLASSVLQAIENESDWFVVSPQLIADRINLSLRQMQRLLAVENTSYQQILDNARKDKALFLLKQNTLNTERIAHVLGYNNVSSFHRAFKRWYDRPPSHYLPNA